MSYLVLARKWRPRTFSELIGQAPVVRALQYALGHGRLHHAYLFSGIRGVGKTTVARILAKALNCEQGIVAEPCGHCANCRAIDSGRFVDLIEVDAASRTKVDDTRELLDNVQYAPTEGRFKVYLIDEVHMLSAHSFNALLKTLEEPPPHVKFILATTDPQRLPVTVLSRCLKFSLKRVSDHDIVHHVESILTTEGVLFDRDALFAIARSAEGSLRDALSLVDQAVAVGDGAVRSSTVVEMLGSIAPDLIERIVSGLVKGAPQTMLEVADQAFVLGVAPDALLVDLLRALHEIAVIQVITPNVEMIAWMRDAAQSLGADEVQLYYEIGCQGRRQLPVAPDPELGVKMTLLRMAAFKPTPLLQESLARDRPIAPSKQSVGVLTPQSATHHLQPGRDGDSGPTSRGEFPIRSNEAGSTTSSLSTTGSILEALPLVGLVRHLALNAFFEKRDDAFVLTFDPAVAHLVNKERVEVLKEALSSYYGQSLTLVTSVGVSTNTPAQLKKQADQTAMSRATQAIAQDPGVVALERTFNARVRSVSVKPRTSDG